MPTLLSKDQFIEILFDKEITRQKDIDLFQVMYSFPEHKAPASQVGRLLGGKSKFPASPVNIQIGNLAKRIAKKHDINFAKRQNMLNKYWPIFFTGTYDGSLFIWKLRRELVLALVEADLTGEIQYAEEIPFDNTDKFPEGAKTKIWVNFYERSSQARKLCIKHWKAICSVCEFDFNKEYGEIGNNFIHVHHISPISEVENAYEVDPINDLRPVCPNCHSMLHREKDTLTIEELKGYYNNASARTKSYR